MHKFKSKNVTVNYNLIINISVGDMVDSIFEAIKKLLRR